MADGGAEPQDEHLGGAGPPGPLPPSPSHNRALLLAEDITATKRPRLSLGTQASPGDPRAPGSRGGPGGAGGRGQAGWRGCTPSCCGSWRCRSCSRRWQPGTRSSCTVTAGSGSWSWKTGSSGAKSAAWRRMTCCPPEVAAGDPWLPLPPPPGPCWPLAPAALASVTATSLKGLVGLLESNATVQENGRPKLELVPNSGVYVTHLQLDNVSQVSTDKPKLMTQRLLDYFWWETLARSSATGQHIAHNATMERPLRLPMAMVNAIKEHGTKLCGHGCNFNAVINSKCGRSWWAVRKVVVE